MAPPLLHVIAWFQRDQSCDVMGRRIFSAIFGRNGRRSERAREGITTVHEQDVLHGSPLSGHELGKINEAGGVTPFIVVPRKNFNDSIVQNHGALCIDDA